MKIGIRIDKLLEKTFSQRIQEIAKGREGLVQREVDVHRRGKTFKQKRWVRPGEGVSQPKWKKQDTDKPSKSKGKPDAKKLGIKKPSGEFKHGDKVSGVDVDGKKVSGTVTAVGADGVTVDHKFHVEHGKAKKAPEQGSEIDFSSKKEPGKKKTAAADKPGKQEKTEPPKRAYISSDKFNASDYAKQWEDQAATADEAGKEHILKSYGAEGEAIANAIRDCDNRNQRLIDDKQLTHQQYRVSGEGESARYTPEREKLHGRIMDGLLHPDKIRSAMPPPGQKPKFIILGGRGGSGKSWFRNNLYDPSTTVILDADEIKEKIPEYKGWNANQVHEESSDILDGKTGYKQV